MSFPSLSLPLLLPSLSLPSLSQQGFVARCPGSGLPPLDPYVEIDQNALHPSPHGATSNRLNAQHENYVQNGFSTTHNGLTPQHLVSDFGQLSVGEEYMSPGFTNGHVSPGAGNGRVSPGRRRNAKNSSTSYRLVARGLVDKDETASIKTNSDGLSSSSSDGGSSVESDGGLPPPPPPLVSKGRHACPRCARRFQDKKTFQQHRDRCLA